MSIEAELARLYRLLDDARAARAAAYANLKACEANTPGKCRRELSAVAQAEALVKSLQRQIANLQKREAVR